MAAADGVDRIDGSGVCARPIGHQRKHDADPGTGRFDASDGRRVSRYAAAIGSSVRAMVRTWCLRSPVANFTIVREAPVERYYVRMYDGATPPNYSAFFQRHIRERSNAMRRDMGGSRMDMMSTFEAQVLADLSVVKSQMASLLGDGQPGRLSLLEERVERHELSVQRVKGFAGAFGLLVHTAATVVEWLRPR